MVIDLKSGLKCQMGLDQTYMMTANITVITKDEMPFSYHIVIHCATKTITLGWWYLYVCRKIATTT